MKTEKMSNGRKSPQIAITGRNTDEYRRLAAFLSEEGYELHGRFAELREDDHIVAVVVDLNQRTAFDTSSAMMACRASCGIKPICVDDFIHK